MLLKLAVRGSAIETLMIPSHRNFVSTARPRMECI